MCTEKEATLSPDIEQAARYIEALTGSPDTVMSWCLLHEQRKGVKGPFIASLSDISPRLVALNKGGFGVFITVNQLAANATTRRAKDVVGLRALFVDFDHRPSKAPALPASFGVRSARGDHLYWRLQQGEPLNLFETAQKQLAAYFDADSKVSDLPRLMRVPGFYHQKREPHLVTFLAGTGETHSLSEVLKAHPVSADELRRAMASTPIIDAARRSPGTPAMTSVDLPPMYERKRLAAAYLRRMPPAIEGAGGDGQTYVAACVVVRDFAIDNYHDAMEVLSAYNATCSPPWDERGLAAKLRSAFQSAGGVFGLKLSKQQSEHDLMQEWMRGANGADASAGGQPLVTGADGLTDGDGPYSHHIMTLVAKDPASVLDSVVIATLANLQQRDEPEYMRCLLEMRGCGGLLATVRKCVGRHQFNARETTRDPAQEDDQNLACLLDLYPAAAEVINTQHRLPQNYILDWDGVKLRQEKWTKYGPDKVMISVCDNPVVIKTILDRVDGGGALLELAYRTRSSEWHKVIAPREVVFTNRLLTGLAKTSLFPVNSSNSSAMVEYLARYETVNQRAIARKKAAVQMGWQGEDRDLGFLIGKRQIMPKGVTADAVEFATDSEGDKLLAESFREKGQFNEWLEGLLMIGQEYPKVHLGILGSLAAPLLEILELDNFFIDYSGETSSGKTTALRIAASVWGPPTHQKYSLVRSWNATAIGLERTAAMLSGLPLFIDESSEAKSQKEKENLGKLIYQLGNGRGRTRGTKTLSTQQLRFWSTIIISSGEYPIATATQDAGTRARVLALEDSPFGGITETTSVHVRRLNDIVTRNYGHAGPVFMEWVLSHLHEVPQWQKRHQELAAGYATSADVPAGVSDRLGRHLALLDLAGELSARAFSLPKKYHSPVLASISAAMESAQQADVAKDALLDVVSQAYASRARLFGESCREPTHSYIGKRHVSCGGHHCMALTSEFVRQSLEKVGFNFYAITRLWNTRGYTVCDPGRSQRVCRIDDGRMRCICIKTSVIDQFMPPE